MLEEKHLNKKKSFLIGIILLIIFFELGFLQSNNITYGDINISKPLFYRYFSAPVEYSEMTFLEKQKHILGYHNTLDMDSIAALSFKNFFLNEKISLQLHSIDSKSAIFVYKYIDHKDTYIEEEKCLYLEEYDAIKNVYVIDGLVKSHNIEFFIMGDSRQDIMKIKKNICEQ